MIKVWTPGTKLADIEKSAIFEAMQFFNGDKKAASSALGISERALYYKLTEYKENGDFIYADEIGDAPPASEGKNKRVQRTRAVSNRPTKGLSLSSIDESIEKLNSL